MRICGIEFADVIHTPLDRRLQTLAALYWNFSFFFFGSAGIFLFFVLLFSPFFFISVLYFCWYVYDIRTPERGSRPKKWARCLKVWDYLRDYFPMRLHKTADLDPEKNYLCVYHPHGITSCGAFTNFCTEATGLSKQFPGIEFRLLTLPCNFYFPFARELPMMQGICSASKSSMEYIMSKCGKGNALVLVVGGAIEALEANPGNLNLYLNKRKGFVKLALKHGTPLVPVYSFGEDDLYVQVPTSSNSFLRKLQNAFTNLFTFSPPIFHGRGIFNYTFGYLPYRRPVNVVVGEPLEVERIDEPSHEDVELWHSKYIEQLTELFEKHKLQFGKKEEDHLHIT